MNVVKGVEMNKLELSLLRRKSHILMVCANTLLNDSRVLKTASSIRKSGYRVTLFGLQEKPSNEPVEVVRGFNFEILRVKNPAWMLKKQGKWSKDGFKDYDSFCKEFANSIINQFANSDYSAIYTHDMYGLAIGGELRKDVHFKKMPWFHDIHEYVRGLTEIDKELYDYVNCKEKELIEKPDKLSTVSPVLASRLSNIYTRKDYHVVLNCPFLGDYDFYYKDVLSDCFGENNEKKRLITYHGNVKPIRGVENLIGALRFLPDIYHAAIICSANNSYTDSLKKLADDTVPGRVHFLPYVPAHKVSSYIRGSYATIHTIHSYPNSEVALPNKLFESLHAGVPFVCPPLEAMQEFVQKYKCGVVAKSNGDKDLADAVLKLDECFYSSKNKNDNQERINREYSWEAMERIIFEKILDPVLIQNSNLPIFINSNKKEPINVVHLPSYSAGQPHSLACALGDKFSAKSASLSISNKYSYSTDITLKRIDLLKSDKSGERQLLKLIQYFDENKEIKKQDIYHFHSRPLLYGKDMLGAHVFSDVALLKKIGKKIFFHFRGSEARLLSIFSQKNPFSWIHEINSSKDEQTKSILISQSPAIFEENGQLSFIDKAKAFSTEVFVTDAEVGSYVPNSTIVPRTVDKKLFQRGSVRALRDFEKKPLRIVHAPSRPFIKGTQFLIDAVERLKKDGYSVEVDLLTGVSNQEVIERCISADLCVDQLRIGWYGVFSVEAMALGLPVICFIRDDLLHYLPDDRPIINANPKTIYGVIKSILDNKSVLDIFGRNAFNYAIKTHHPDVVANILEKIYLDGWEAKKNDHQNYLIDNNLNWLNFNKHKEDIAEIFGVDDENSAEFLTALREETKGNLYLAIKKYEKIEKIVELNSIRQKYLASRIKYLRRKIKQEYS